MDNSTPTESRTDKALYSAIITPNDYLRIIFEEHLYILDAVKYLINFIRENTQSQAGAEVVELGCGPGSILLLAREVNGINLTGVDHDPNFIAHATKLNSNHATEIKQADIKTYQHGKPVNIFFSSGVHHHISKGEQTIQYLKNIHNQLTPNGYYILADEFIPNYESEAEREVKLVIWYSHIISHALKSGYTFLAHEEAKTLLDDIHESYQGKKSKTENQIELVISSVNQINQAAENGNQELASNLATEFLHQLHAMQPTSNIDQKNLKLSRGDYKICDKKLREEASTAGFNIETVKTFGPIDTIGGMAVYFLKKQN